MAVLVLAAEIKDGVKSPVIPIVANSLDLAFTAPSVAGDGISIPLSGREVVIVQNTDVGAQTFSVTSRAIHGRLGDITTYSLAAGEFALLPLNLQELFGTGVTGNMLITMSSALVKVAVIRAVNLQ